MLLHISDCSDHCVAKSKQNFIKRSGFLVSVFLWIFQVLEFCKGLWECKFTIPHNIHSLILKKTNRSNWIENKHWSKFCKNDLWVICRLFKQCLCKRLGDDHFPFSPSDLLAQLCFLWNKGKKRLFTTGSAVWQLTQYVTAGASFF